MRVCQLRCHHMDDNSREQLWVIRLVMCSVQYKSNWVGTRQSVVWQQHWERVSPDSLYRSHHHGICCVMRKNCIASFITYFPISDFPAVHHLRPGFPGEKEGDEPGMLRRTPWLRHVGSGIRNTWATDTWAVHSGYGHLFCTNGLRTLGLHSKSVSYSK